MKERPSLAHSDGWKWKPSVLVFCLLLWQNNDQMQCKWAGNVWAPSSGGWSPPWWVSSSGCESGKQLVTWSFQLGIQKMRADAGLSSFFSYSVRPANLWVNLPSLVKPLWKQADMCYLGGSQPSQIGSEDRPYLPALLYYLSPRKGFLGVPVFKTARCSLASLLTTRPAQSALWSCREYFSRQMKFYKNAQSNSASLT